MIHLLNTTLDAIASNAQDLKNSLSLKGKKMYGEFSEMTFVFLIEDVRLNDESPFS